MTPYTPYSQIPIYISVFLLLIGFMGIYRNLIGFVRSEFRLGVLNANTVVFAIPYAFGCIRISAVVDFPVYDYYTPFIIGIGGMILLGIGMIVERYLTKTSSTTDSIKLTLKNE